MQASSVTDLCNNRIEIDQWYIWASEYEIPQNICPSESYTREYEIQQNICPSEPYTRECG